MHESTIIHSCCPRCTSTLSPYPGPKTDTSTSSYCGGPPKLLPVKQITYTLSPALRPFQFLRPPGWETSEANHRSAGALTTNAIDIADVPIEDCARFDKGPISVGHLFDRELCFLIRTTTHEVNKPGKERIIQDLENGAFPLLQRDKSMLNNRLAHGFSTSEVIRETLYPFCRVGKRGRSLSLPSAAAPT